MSVFGNESNKIDENYGLFTEAGNPIINFDTIDYFQYDRANNRLNLFINGTVPIYVLQNQFFFNGVIPIFRSFTVATLPSASANSRGVIYVADGTTNKRLAVSDGTNWRWPDGAIVS